ncbi:MAG: metallophosphoesterase [Acidobacteriota bacterium]|nr:metallophosphoesterase [Acidobacteriota bacterium]
MIGILSDSHDNLHKIKSAVQLFNELNCTLVIHAGDFVAPFAVRALAGLGCPVKAVFGNCDGEKAGLAKAFEGWGEILEPPLRFVHEERSFLVTHDDCGLERLLGARPPDIIVFGHTHRAEVKKEHGVLFINPGEAGGWLQGKSTIALLDPDDLSVEIMTL